MKPVDIAIFAPQSGREYAEAVCRQLGVPLSAHEEREFEDGEHKIRPLESVRGKDVFVVQNLYGDARETVNDKLCRLLFFLGALRDAAQNLARRDGQGRAILAAEIHQEKCRVRLPGEKAKSGQVDAGQRVGVTRVPAGDLDVVVERVGTVPAENDVAKTKARLGGREEFLE